MVRIEAIQVGRDTWIATYAVPERGILRMKAHIDGSRQGQPEATFAQIMPFINGVEVTNPRGTDVFTEQVFDNFTLRFNSGDLPVTAGTTITFAIRMRTTNVQTFNAQIDMEYEPHPQ